MSHPGSNPMDPASNDASVASAGRLAMIVDMMREMSRQTDPQAMVNVYAERVNRLSPSDGYISVSRRGLDAPWYKVTRASAWDDEPDPWREPHRLPRHTEGLLGRLLYNDLPVIIDDLHVEDDDPFKPLFAGARSIAAIPQYDGGTGLNMVIILSNRPRAFDHGRFPEMVWQSNLFGRATSNLVLSRQLREAYDAIDRELKAVADMQRSLLPSELPVCVGLDLASHYQTSRNAGGDYYDFFDLGDGKLGILIADVSGHGTPAAVLMAILHAIAHLHPTGMPTEPRHWMSYVNRQLCQRYTRGGGTFVTAFYAVYDASTRELQYASAGHNPPRLRLANAICSLSPIDPANPSLKRPDDAGTPVILPLDQAQGLPLGIMQDWEYADTTVTLTPGDVLTFYTDGITEAMDTANELFGEKRLDEALMQERSVTAEYLAEIVRRVDAHAHGRPHQDDRTLVIARVVGCDQPLSRDA